MRTRTQLSNPHVHLSAAAGIVHRTRNSAPVGDEKRAREIHSMSQSRHKHKQGGWATLEKGCETQTTKESKRIFLMPARVMRSPPLVQPPWPSGKCNSVLKRPIKGSTSNQRTPEIRLSGKSSAVGIQSLNIPRSFHLRGSFRLLNPGAIVLDASIHQYPPMLTGKGYKLRHGSCFGRSL